MTRKTTNLYTARQASTWTKPVAVSPTSAAATVQPKPLAPASAGALAMAGAIAPAALVALVTPVAHRAELSREVRIALDALSARGLTSPARMRTARPSGSAPFICG